MTHCTIVVPCYNEAARLQTADFRRYLDTSPGISMLFVNDGSKDRTLDVLRELERDAPRVRVLDKRPNGGKAEAVRDGMLLALNDPNVQFVGFWDADLATPLDAIGDLLDVLANDPDLEMIFGSRVKLLGRDVQRRMVRHYLGRVFATITSVVLQLPVYDTQCGAKIFRATPDLRRVLQDPFRSRWIFDVELIARFLQLYSAAGTSVEGRIYEFPLHCWRDVPGSKLRAGDFARAILDLWDIWRQYIR